MGSCRSALTLLLSLGPSSLGFVPGWCQSAQCARAGLGPIQSASVRPEVGATRSPPSPPWHPGSPGQPRTQHHRPQIPMARQRWTETQMTGTDRASLTPATSRAIKCKFSSDITNTCCVVVWIGGLGRRTDSLLLA